MSDASTSSLVPKSSGGMKAGVPQATTFRNSCFRIEEEEEVRDMAECWEVSEERLSMLVDTKVVEEEEREDPIEE